MISEIMLEGMYFEYVAKALDAGKKIMLFSQYRHQFLRATNFTVV